TLHADASGRDIVPGQSSAPGADPDGLMSRRPGQAVVGARVESAEVRYAIEAVITVDAEDVAQLKREAQRNPRRRVRLCAHGGIDDSLHEMLIVHANNTYVRPHRHLGKSESFHVIEGDVEVVL